MIQALNEWKKNMPTKMPNENRIYVGLGELHKLNSAIRKTVQCWA